MNARTKTNTASNGTGKGKVEDRHLLGVGAAACAVCCAPPLLGMLGIAAGAVATIATLALAGIVFGLVVLAASLVAGLIRRRRRAATAGTVSEPVAVTITAKPRVTH